MRETHLIPLATDEQDGKFIIYRPLIGMAFIGNRAMANLALTLTDSGPTEADQGGDEISKFLIRSGFFLPDVEPGEIPRLPSAAVLLLTNRCQLKCGYCYAAGGDYSTKTLKLETAKAVIDYVAACAERQGASTFRLEFHGGGEPTIEWKVLQSAVEWARSKPIRAHISVTSNAMWSEDQCHWLMKNLNAISVSMDGNNETQNRNRPLASGKPSFPIVMRNLKMMDEQDFSYGIRMTATAPWDQLQENVRFIVEQTKCRGIQVEPAFNPTRGGHGNTSAEESSAFIRAFQDAYMVAKEHQAELRYAGAKPGNTARQFCTAPYNALVVNPEDDIVACYEVVNRNHELYASAVFGHVKDGQVILIPSARENLVERIHERFIRCKDCFCHWTCAGDCYIRVFQPGENGHLIFNERCEINRELTRFLLLHLIADSGGVWNKFLSRNPAQDFPNG